MEPLTFDEAVHESIVNILGSWGFWLFASIIIIIFQSSIKDLAYGFTWRIGSGFRKNTIVNLDGEYARISHLGLFKTEFIVYYWDKENQKHVVGGESFPVPNFRLRDMNIRIPLPILDLPVELRKVVK